MRATFELGQYVKGDVIFEHACPSFVEAGLRHLEDRISISYWNENQEEWASAFGNTGGEYITAFFQVRSYYWGDNEELAALPNFACGGFAVRWYKYLGRGMSMNIPIRPSVFFRMLDKCIASLP